jgi:DNA-directed RNA polymerase specialized sigma24 family protein
VVADTRQPQAVREHSLQQLRPVIESIARRVSAGFRGNLHQDLIAESCAIVWLQIPRFDPARGRFEDWCRVVLYHHALDVWRKSRRGPVRPAVGGDAVQAMMEAVVNDDARAAGVEALARCREARRVLDRIAWPAPRAVDYFAVLLLQLRVAAARYLTPGPLS